MGLLRSRSVALPISSLVTAVCLPPSADPCENVTCSGNGLCVAGTCTCLPGFSGATCDYRNPLASTYFWRGSNWDSCSRACGGGSARRTAICMESRVDVLLNNRSVVPAASSASCNVFQRPSLQRDCRTVACGGSAVEVGFKIAVNASLATVSDALQSAVSAALLAELVVVLAAEFPALTPTDIAARLSVTRIIASDGGTLWPTGGTAVDVGFTSTNATSMIVAVDVISSTTTLTTSPDIPATTIAAVLQQQAASITSLMRGRATLLRQLQPFAPNELAALTFLNASSASDGIVVLNASATTRLDLADNSLLSSVSVGVIAGAVIGIVAGIFALGSLAFLAWRCSLKVRDNPRP